jgi:protein-lysine N-methyltransferase EEF2KMT
MTLIILPEWKPTEGATTYDNNADISLITASQRRNAPHTVDSKIHHNNLINNILPKIQANLAGCADAIMLDVEGYVSETNATNLFMVDNGVLLTPHADHCLPGITRATVLEIAAAMNIPTEVRRISLAEFHSADEVSTRIYTLFTSNPLFGIGLRHGNHGRAHSCCQYRRSRDWDRCSWTDNTEIAGRIQDLTRR